MPYGNVSQAVVYDGQGDIVDDKPTTPDTPEIPNEPDINWDEEEPDVDNPYYDQYDPNKWPNWLDFLKWLWDWLMGLFG